MVETIRFRKIYLEDLATGSGTDAVTVADGSIASLTRVNLTSLGGSGGVDWIDFTEQSATPATPGTGVARLYRKTDNKQYLKDDAGTEKEYPFTVGTIESGTWQGTAIAAGYGGTGLATYAVGDILYASAATTLAKLAAVATGQVLVSRGVTTAPAWTDLLFLNDSANANMTIGLTINQGANDNEILSLKSSDVNHGMTTETETDSYGRIAKVDAATGGLQVEGYNAGGTALVLMGHAVTDDTGKATTSGGYLYLSGSKKSGTTIGDIGANANILVVANQATTRFILDGDGDSHQDVGTAWTNFDAWDDVMLLDRLAVAVTRDGDPLREGFVADLEAHRAALEALPGKHLVTFNEDGHHFVNMSRLQMLTVGAVRQLARRLERLETRMLTARH